MKKLIALMMAGTLCISLASCGNKASKTDENTVEIEESVSDTENSDTSSKGNENLKEYSKSDDMYNAWLDEHGITILPQGDFTYTTAINDSSGTIGEISVPCNVSITETTDGCEPGFKKVIGTFVSDLSAANGNSFHVWHSAFDRYTGTSFEFDSNSTILSQGENKVHSDSVVIKNTKDEYEIAISFDSTNNNPEWISIVTVTCPENYDGTVFYNGYSSVELGEENQDFDYASRLYTIDEIPYYGKGLYYFFSFTND